MSEKNPTSFNQETREATNVCHELRVSHRGMAFILIGRSAIQQFCFLC